MLIVRYSSLFESNARWHASLIASSINMLVLFSWTFLLELIIIWLLLMLIACICPDEFPIWWKHCWRKFWLKWCARGRCLRTHTGELWLWRNWLTQTRRGVWDGARYRTEADELLISEMLYSTAETVKYAGGCLMTQAKRQRWCQTGCIRPWK